MAKTIAGLYDSFEDARAVQAALINAGFDRDNISILAANSEDRYKDFVDRNIDESEYDKYYVTDNDTRNRAAEGATAGGILGGLGGLVLALLVPGAGPFTVTGWLAASLIGLAGGAITGGILGALVDAGIDEEDATVYSEGVRRGYALVTVKAEDGQAAQIAGIMNDHNAIDTDQRAAYWKSQGWDNSYDADEPVYNLTQIEEERTSYNTYIGDVDAKGSATVPVIQEELRVGKREVDAGGVRVRTYVDRDKVEETVTLTKETVDVDRKIVDREVSAADIDAFEEGVVEVTATAEEVVTGKVAKVVEEVTIRKDVDQVRETVTDTVRRTGVDVDHDINGISDTLYRDHYATTYASTNYDYDYYAPHYRYGYGLASNPTYSGRDWNLVEGDVRRDWETQYSDGDSTWDDVKDAVRSGWYSVKNAVS